jgi:hypothetical protein
MGPGVRLWLGQQTSCQDVLAEQVGLRGKRPKNESDPAPAADFASY